MNISLNERQLSIIKHALNFHRAEMLKASATTTDPRPKIIAKRADEVLMDLEIVELKN